MCLPSRFSCLGGLPKAGRHRGRSPVFTDGALFSTGDGHFAQGDGEVCVTAVEMGATAVVRFKLHKGVAERRKFTSPVFSRETYFTEPRFAAPERLLGVMGMPINRA